MTTKGKALFVLGVCLCAIPFCPLLGRAAVAGMQMTREKKTIDERVSQYGPAVRVRLAPYFARSAVPYPPKQITLVGLKAERTVEIWVSSKDGAWKHLRDYPILGMSGRLGPKLREGDRQVPEGIYRIESLNPNSRYHLALRVNYPNTEDCRRGKEDGRANLGSDIMIHGNNCSIGCLAMGDEAAEDLFVMAAETGIGNIRVILSPVDFRVRSLPGERRAGPEWSDELYASIKKELASVTTAGRGGTKEE